MLVGKSSSRPVGSAIKESTAGTATSGVVSAMDARTASTTVPANVINARAPGDKGWRFMLQSFYKLGEGVAMTARTASMAVGWISAKQGNSVCQTTAISARLRQLLHLVATDLGPAQKAKNPHSDLSVGSVKAAAGATSSLMYGGEGGSRTRVSLCVQKSQEIRK